MDVLRRPAGDTGRPDVLLVSVGALAPMCLEIAALLDAQGITSTVVDPRWVKPVDPELPALAAGHRVVVTVEDNGRAGGVGSAVAQALRDAEVDVPLRDFGIPQQFLAHAKRGEVLADIGLTPAEIAGGIGAALTRITARSAGAAAARTAGTAAGADAAADANARDAPGSRAARGGLGDPTVPAPARPAHTSVGGTTGGGTSATSGTGSTHAGKEQVSDDIV
jgi:1-deoxy-D-xylulose-5-phosphate synthase